MLLAWFSKAITQIEYNWRALMDAMYLTTTLSALGCFGQKFVRHMKLHKKMLQYNGDQVNHHLNLPKVVPLFQILIIGAKIGYMHQVLI